MIYVPSQKLSDNFTMREVSRSSTADRLGIDNTPGATVLTRARDLAVKVLQPVRDHYGVGFSPNSWYRSEDLEKVIARRGFERWCEKNMFDISSPLIWQRYFARKQHPTGMAADIEIPGIDNDVLFEWIKINLKYDQLIREFRRKGDPKSGWVHVSYKAEQNRMQAFHIG